MAFFANRAPEGGEGTLGVKYYSTVKSWMMVGGQGENGEDVVCKTVHGGGRKDYYVYCYVPCAG